MVISKRLHGNFAPQFIIFMAIPHDSHDLIVTVCKDVRLDCDRFTHRSFDRVPAAFHFRINASNDDALRRLIAHMKSLTRRRRPGILSET